MGTTKLWADLDFDGALRVFSDWTGQNVSVQVHGSAELAIHVDGQLQPIDADETTALVFVQLDPDEDATVLGSGAITLTGVLGQQLANDARNRDPGLMISVALDPVLRAAESNA